MKAVIGGLVLSLVGVATAHAQVLTNNDPFQGTWKINLAKSTSTRTLPKDEVIVIKIANNAQYKSGHVTQADGTVTKSDYTATYNDGKWYPVKNLVTNRPGGTTMMIRMEERREMRFMKREAGQYGGMLLRVVSPDGKTMRIVGYDVGGAVTYNLMFDKQPET